MESRIEGKQKYASDNVHHFSPLRKSTHKSEGNETIETGFHTHRPDECIDEKPHVTPCNLVA